MAENENNKKPQAQNNKNDSPKKKGADRPKDSTPRSKDSNDRKKDTKRRSKDNNGRPSNQRRSSTNRGGNNRGNNNRRPSSPRRVSGGIRLRSTSGKSARNWWAQRWIRSMENVVDVNRLRRGRYYAQQGQVLNIEEGDAEMIAKVQGSRPKPYTVRISLVPFNDEEWDKLLEVLSGKAIFSAELLNGHMPNNIEEAFSEAEVSLFPNRTGELLTDCTCPDWANPCKHVAATQYILGDRFDDDPFLLFRLRGRTQEQILDGLRRHRIGDVVDVDHLPVEEATEVNEEDLPIEQQPLVLDEKMMENFWHGTNNLHDFPIHIKAPEVQFPVIKRLGEPDAAGHYSLEELLGNSYMAVSQAAQIIAFTGGDYLEDDDED
jgi:uncharacterized Zn finger protein